MKLEFLGAARVVTGSCYLLETNGHKLLVDCGMFQGSKRVRAMNYEEFAFNPADIDCVLLTHAHVDHCGLIPKLVREGFKGEIYATKATCDLATIMLPDSAHIQESDAEMMNRKGQRSGDAPIMPLYDIDDATDALSHFKAIPYGERFAVEDNVEIIFRDAGHIIGSAIIEVFVSEDEKTTKLVFSGDLGQPKQPIIKDPTVIDGADYLLVESTYGDRLHKIYDKEQALAEIVNDTMDRGGNLIIPSFAVGRTQTLIYYFYRLWKSGRIDGEVPIIIDSPLAIEASTIFGKNVQDFDDETLSMMKNGEFEKMPQLRFCKTPEESRALNSEESSAIIISASGMADAGRILHHLKHNLWRPESTILFVGYQAEGSLGRRLVDGIKRVKVMGEDIAVRAKIQVLNGFSAHADSSQILEWVGNIQNPKPAKVFIVHGESAAQGALQNELTKELGLDVYVPFKGDSVMIEGRECEIQASALPKVVVEKEMEDYLQTLDSAYRSFRRNVLQFVIRQPQQMEPLIRTIDKGWNYMKKLFANYNF